MIKMLTEEDIDKVFPFIQETAGAVTDMQLPEQRYAAVLATFDRAKEVGNVGTGVFGYYEEDQLKLLISVWTWRNMPYYTLRNVYGKSGKWEAVTTLIEFAVKYMEERGYYTFFWGRPILKGEDGPTLRTRLFLTDLLTRYDVVVECYKNVGRSLTFDTFLTEFENTAVFRASLKNEFRPYQASGPSF